MGKKRIVPDHERRRTARSCDRCKRRKKRCVQGLDFGRGCVTCVRAGAICETTIPRREKGSQKAVEELQFEVFVLKQTVRSLVSGLDLDSIDAVVRYCEENGVDLSGAPAISETAKRSPDGEELASKPLQEKEPKREEDVEGTNIGKNYGNIVAVRSQRHGFSKRPKINDSAVERLVYDKEGRTYYIGYASTFAVFNGLCNLAVKNSAVTKLTFDNHIHTYQSDESKSVFSSESGVAAGSVPVLAMASDFVPLWYKVPDIAIPSRAEADYYVGCFFRKVHHYYYIFSEDTFMDRYRIFWQEVDSLSLAGSYGFSVAKIMEIRALSSEWSYCIYLVWILGAKANSFPNGVLGDTEINKLVNIIKLGLPGLILKNSLMSIRILYLLAVHWYSCRNKNAAWTLIGLACRQAISLGLHRESGVLNLKYKRPISLRKQIWWSLYIFEVTMGSSFGRPIIISNNEINIGYPSDLYTKPGEEEFLPYYLETITLTKLLNEIFQVRSSIYNDSEQSPFGLEVMSKTLAIRKKLLSFYADLERKHMSLEWAIKDMQASMTSESGVKRFKFDLSMNYHCYMIIMTLPFVLYTVNLLVVQPDFLAHLDEPIITILTSGIHSSVEFSKIMQMYHELDILEGNLFSDMFYGYAATMVLVLVFFMLRIVSNLEKAGDQEMISQWKSQFKISGGLPITMNLVLSSIYRIRVAMKSENIVIGETMRRSINVIEDFIQDVGIVELLDRMYGPVETDVQSEKQPEQFIEQPRNTFNSAIELDSDMINSIIETDFSSYLAPYFDMDSLFENGTGMQVNFTDDQFRDFMEQWTEE